MIIRSHTEMYDHQKADRNPEMYDFEVVDEVKTTGDDERFINVKLYDK